MRYLRNEMWPHRHFGSFGILLPMVLILALVEIAGAKPANISVNGSVINDSTNEGIPQLKVEFRPSEDSPDDAPIRETSTNQDGFFEFEYLYADTKYEIRIFDTQGNSLYQTSMTLTESTSLPPIRLQLSN